MRGGGGGRGICMGRHLRQNDTNISEIYIGCPIYILDLQYIYPTSEIQYIPDFG